MLRIVLWTLAGIVMLESSSPACSPRARRVPVSRPAAAPSPRSDVAWRAATCVVLPVGQATGATSARDRAGGARDRDPGRHRDGDTGRATSWAPRWTPSPHASGSAPIDRSPSWRSRCRRARPVHFANTARAVFRSARTREWSNAHMRIPSRRRRVRRSMSRPPRTRPASRRPAGRRCDRDPDLGVDDRTGLEQHRRGIGLPGGAVDQGGVSGWAQVTTIGQNVTGFTDSSLSAATTYFYRVIAVRDGVDSVPSAVASATTTSTRRRRRHRSPSRRIQPRSP